MVEARGANLQRAEPRKREVYKHPNQQHPNGIHGLIALRLEITERPLKYLSVKAISV